MVNDVVAVDDVSVVDKPCETGYFVIRDFSTLIATSQKGDYIYSPKMYTDDGYAFQIKVRKFKRYFFYFYQTVRSL